jgi:hypothetical protein
MPQVAQHFLEDCSNVTDATARASLPDVCAEVFFSFSCLLSPDDLRSTDQPWWSACATSSHAFCNFLQAVARHLPLHSNQVCQLPWDFMDCLWKWISWLLACLYVSHAAISAGAAVALREMTHLIE